MNSYQPNISVSTILNLDSGVSTEPVKPVQDNAPIEKPFQRVLDDQEQIQKPRSESRDVVAEKSPEREPTRNNEPDTEVAVVDRDTAPSDPETTQTKDDVTKESQASESDKSSDVSIPLEAVVEKSSVEVEADEVVTEVTIAEDDGSVLPDADEAPSGAAAIASAPVLPADSSAPPRKSEADAQNIDPLKAYRVNVSGNPIDLKEAKQGSPIEQFKLDKELGLANKAEFSAQGVEVKASGAKQLNTMIAQMVAGQPTRSAEQIVKDIAAKLDVKGGREGAATPLTTVLNRPLVSRPVNAPTAVVSPLQAQIKAAVGQPQWQTAISERVAFMASQNIKTAEIQLDPPELGPLQVRVTVNQDQASVSFASHHSQVREALDQTAFRLRDMLQQEGMNQVNVDVSDQSEYQGQQQSEQSAAGDVQQEVEADAEGSLRVVTEVSTALVDHFV